MKYAAFKFGKMRLLGFLVVLPVLGLVVLLSGNKVLADTNSCFLSGLGTDGYKHAVIETYYGSLQPVSSPPYGVKNYCSTSCGPSTFCLGGNIYNCNGYCSTLSRNWDRLVCYGQCNYYCPNPTFVAPPPPPPPPTLNITYPASYKITNANGLDLPHGIYTVAVNVPGQTLTEPPTGNQFVVVAGSTGGSIACNAQYQDPKSKNASCYLKANIRNLHFGIVAPPDISCEFKRANKTVFYPGEIGSFTYTITNPSASTVTTAVGFWPRGATVTNPLPNCANNTVGVPPSPPVVQTVTLAPNSTQDVTFDFTCGTVGATAYAAVTYACTPADIEWSNNVSRGQAYVVITPTFFETSDGDVGSHGTISVSQLPPPAKYQSTYLLAGTDLGNKLTTPSNAFRLNNYDQILVPTGGVYNYLAERFLQAAKDERPGGQDCVIPAGSVTGFRHCSGNADFDAGGPPQGNAVWFIDGNLTIKKDLILGGSDTATFIVAGDITVNSDVNRADGVYIAGRAYRDYDPNFSYYGRQLVINGGVYAENVDLSRKLGPPLCPAGTPECDNTLTAPDKFVFDPKYLAGLNSILASPRITWQEVAP